MKITKRWRFFFPSFLLIGWMWIIVGNVAAGAEETKGVVEYEAGFYYTVQKGDTLWDLSQRFNDTPWQWPDVWQENTQIPNPHLIYPGERIRLFRKKGQHGYQTAQPQAPQVTAATPAEQSPPEVYYWYSNIDHIGFIRNPAVSPAGVIFKSRDDKKLISKGDLVYLSPPDSGAKVDFSPGMRLTAYRELSPTEDGNSRAAIGTQHYLVGIVEVVKNEAQFAVAKVLQSFRAINVGDSVMEYNPRHPQFTVVDSTPGIEGHIIAAEEHTKMMGDLSIAFIDKGQQDKIVPGQVYTLYYQESAPVGSGNKEVLLDKVDIGSIFVLHTEQTTSTVVITECNQQIKDGQPIRTP